MEIQINVDCADLDRMVSFYGAALGYTPHGSAGSTYRSMTRPGLPKLVFQRVPESKVVKNRVHLDVIVGPEIEAEAARWVGLGATRVEHIEEFDGEWIVMLDPEGNELCICNC
ncbi:MAG TPA: VOC family protein [Acidimicrobiia bacterium]|nr:VOC family protein [Acidimicrobiia bacterium]